MSEDAVFFESVKELCVLTAQAIDVIANEFNKNPENVFDFYIKVYQTINEKARWVIS